MNEERLFTETQLKQAIKLAQELVWADLEQTEKELKYEPEEVMEIIKNQNEQTNEKGN